MGHILFDPLKYEALKLIKKPDPSYASKDVLRTFLRTENKVDDTTKKPCKSYDYDDTICKLLGDRAICGYNKNLGDLKDSTAIIDIGDGCFIRGDRVECGYVLGPFTYSRRPPADTKIRSDEPQKLQDSLKQNSDSANEASTKSQTTKTEATTNKSTTVTDVTKTTLTTHLRNTITKATKMEATTKDRNTITGSTKTDKCAQKISTESHNSNVNTNKNIKESYKDDTTSTTIKSTTPNVLTTKISTFLKITGTTSMQTTTEQIASTERYKTNCVEKSDHLFCYEL